MLALDRLLSKYICNSRLGLIQARREGSLANALGGKRATAKSSRLQANQPNIQNGFIPS